MTTSRIVRGTKGRIFIYVCVILIITGIIACYNSTRVELENVQKSNNLCHQQQENLSTQLQVISDYKQRLEKSLKTEKAEHQQAKTELESRINEEKLKYQKSSGEATLKFNSLQQHFNLLQTQHDDAKEECGKKQREQLDIINNLQAKLKEIQGQLKQSERESENTLEHLKDKIEQLKTEKVNLENHIQDIAKREYVPSVDKHYEYKVQNGINQETLQAPNISDIDAIKPSFAKQQPIDNSEYKISGGNNNNVGEHPPNIDEEQNNVNHVMPPPNKIQSSTPNSVIKSSKANMNVVPLLKVPTMTPETAKNKTERSSGDNSPVPIPSPSKKLPDGVVAVQELPPEEDKQQNSKGDNDVVVNLVNNRYRNVADDGSDKEQSAKENMIEVQEGENNGNEILDLGLNDDPNVGGKHDEEKKNHFDNYDQLPPNDANIEENEDVVVFHNITRG